MLVNKDLPKRNHNIETLKRESYRVQVIYVSAAIETLRFSRLNEPNVSLVAICAVI